MIPGPVLLTISTNHRKVNRELLESPVPEVLKPVDLITVLILTKVMAVSISQEMDCGKLSVVQSFL